MKEPEDKVLARMALDEIKGDAPELAKRLFGSGTHDTEQMPRSRFLSIIGSNWYAGPDGGLAFREERLEEMAPAIDGKRPKEGVDRFAELYRDLVVGGHIPPDPPPEAAMAAQQALMQRAQQEAMQQQAQMAPMAAPGMVPG